MGLPKFYKMLRQLVWSYNRAQITYFILSLYVPWPPDPVSLAALFPDIKVKGLLMSANTKL